MTAAGRWQRRPPSSCGPVVVYVALGTVAALLLPFGAAALDGLSAEALPAALGAGRADPRVRALWSEGLEHERREELLASTRRYRAIATTFPESAFIRWRISRNYWRYAERLAPGDKKGRLHHLGLAHRWATRALELDSECGECILWKLAATGRLATTAGVVEAMRMASSIADMIDRGIALNPTHDDGRSNISLANLYYAGAAFYRIVPDWFWVEWLIGVKGDKRRSLDYIHRALAISNPRVDYQVELGAVLLCMGHDTGDRARLEEGRRALRAAMEIPHFQGTDPVDLEHARILMAEPQRACGYSRDGWIDLSQEPSP